MKMDQAFDIGIIGGADGPTRIFIDGSRLNLPILIIVAAVVLVMLGLAVFGLVKSIGKQNKASTIIFSVLASICSLILIAGSIFVKRQHQLARYYNLLKEFSQNIGGQEKEKPLMDSKAESSEQNMEEPHPLSLNLNVGDTVTLRGYFCNFNGWPPNIRFVTDQNEIIGIGMEEWYDDPLVQNILDNQANAEIIFQTKSIFKYQGNVDIQYYDRPLMCFSVESVEFIDEPDSTERLIRGKHVKEEYPSNLTWNGTNAKPILDTDSKKNYRTVITEASQLPPDFNGRYKIASFGAGTMAHGFFIINLETGAVIEGPGYEYSLDYSIDSKLIIRNPKEEILNFWKDELKGDVEIPRWSITEYYLFEDDKLTVIDSGYEF